MIEIEIEKEDIGIGLDLVQGIDMTIHRHLDLDHVPKG